MPYHDEQLEQSEAVDPARPDRSVAIEAGTSARARSATALDDPESNRSYRGHLHFGSGAIDHDLPGQLTEGRIIPEARKLRLDAGPGDGVLPA